MKLQIETPNRLVDINRLPLDKIEDTPEGGLRIGTMVRNSDLAADLRVRRHYGVLSRATVGCQRVAPEQGHHRRQPAAADTVCIFLYRNYTVQQAQPWFGVRGFSRRESDERHTWWQ